MRILSFVILCIASSVALAGGDYVVGKIASFSGENGNFLFRFVQTDGRSNLLPDCREFEVRVNYERVPWFSWLPFVYTSHPTKEKTKEAALFLLSANQTSSEVHFGYMGFGLVPSGISCSFLSRGMSLEVEKTFYLVLSFHDDV